MVDHDMVDCKFCMRETNDQSTISHSTTISHQKMRRDMSRKNMRWEM